MGNKTMTQKRWLMIRKLQKQATAIIKAERDGDLRYFDRMIRRALRGNDMGRRKPSTKHIRDRKNQRLWEKFLKEFEKEKALRALAETRKAKE